MCYRSLERVCMMMNIYFIMFILKKFEKDIYDDEYLFFRFEIWSLKRIGNEGERSILCKALWMFSNLIVV